MNAASILGVAIDQLEDVTKPPKITYKLVESALTPHQDRTAPFTPIEAAIRDHFDVFLDYLSHFENFVQAGLVRPKEIRPYLKYWTNALAATITSTRACLPSFGSLWTDMTTGMQEL
ncbi:MAG TPA: hypothetical protein VIX89_05050 [Bryobacteraceae bacterium]